MKVELSEEGRQLILLALAELALSRPGFDYALRQLALLFLGEEMFEHFKKLNADRVKESRSSV